MEANAEELPFETESLDGYSIAFGIRNVTHIDKALREAHRVRPHYSLCKSLILTLALFCQVQILDVMVDSGTCHRKLTSILS